MAIRTKCTCGKPLRISSKHAGKKLMCPDCGKPFRIPAETFKAAEAAAAAKRRPAVPPKAAAPAAPAPIELDIQPANLDQEILPANLDSPGEFEHSRSDGLIELETRPDGVGVNSSCPVALPVEGADPVTVGYASRLRRRRYYSRNAAGDVIHDPKRGFWADAFGAFVYPIMNRENAATFGAISLVVLLPMAVGFLVSFLAPFLGIFVFPVVLLAIIVTGLVFLWLLALYLSVVLDSAAGSDDLPGFSMNNGIIDDVIKPAFKYIGAYLIVLLPGILLRLCILLSLVPSSLGFLVPVWLVVGAFLVPMSLILFSFSAEGLLFRPDLIVATIIRTLLPYLAMWLMLLLVIMAHLMAVSPTVLVYIGLQNYAPDLTSLGVIGEVVTQIIEVYLTIVAMRIIGLYYLHFKKRFAIVME